MRILIVSSGEDSGGVGNALKRAFDKHTDWNVRQVRFNDNYLRYPSDITLDADNLSLVDVLFEQADVIHFMERWFGERRYAKWDDKAKIMHHHGTIFRSDPNPLMRQAEAYGAMSVVATLDLMTVAPPGELRWMPNPIDIEYMANIRAAHYQPTQRPLVVHAPTGREKKGTDVWLTALAPLDADLQLIEGRRWVECLDLKARGDLLMDQLRVGYGLNAIEAWAMGIPVISGVGDANVADLMRQTIGYLPFYMCTPSTVQERLREIVENADLRREYAAIGEEYVHDFHDERKVVAQWQDIYREAVER